MQSLQSLVLQPQVYLRVQRFNAAIRDIKAFSGMTPTSLSQKVDDFYNEQTGYYFL